MKLSDLPANWIVVLACRSVQICISKASRLVRELMTCVWDQRVDSDQRAIHRTKSDDRTFGRSSIDLTSINNR